MKILNTNKAIYSKRLAKIQTPYINSKYINKETRTELLCK